MASGHVNTRPPTYKGEDTRPTSNKEILGFYAYSFAAEVFVVCALGAFIPITLEDLARASPSAVLAKDPTKPCRAESLDAFSAPKPTEQCIFQLFGTEINTASFAMYSFSVSVLVQAVVVVTMSGAADHGRYRKTLLLAFAVVGALATTLFISVTPPLFLLGSLLAIIGNVCFGASFVLLNSFLPVLIRYHPLVRSSTNSGGSTLDSDDANSIDQSVAVGANESTALLSHSKSVESDEAMQLSTKISSSAVGIGYLAAVIVQFIAIAILSGTGATLFSLRLVLFAIGIWWLIFTIPALFLLRSRPGPPLPVDPVTGRARSWAAYLFHSWATLARTIVRAGKLRDVIIFLAAWFMISDAIATVSGTAILYAKTTLGMKPSALALINVIVTLCGIAGALTWSKISRMLQLTPSQTILVCMCLFELIPLYALLGYIPAVQRLGYLGLQQQWEVYPIGAVFGLVLGGLSSYCRSLYGELIPPGSEVAFYALYAITDKGSSIFGPAIVGAITDATGEIRPSFWFLAVLIGLPIPLMRMLDVERGKRDGLALAKELSLEASAESSPSPSRM